MISKPQPQKLIWGFHLGEKRLLLSWGGVSRMWREGVLVLHPLGVPAGVKADTWVACVLGTHLWLALGSSQAAQCPWPASQPSRETQRGDAAGAGRQARGLQELQPGLDGAASGCGHLGSVRCSCRLLSVLSTRVGRRLAAPFPEHLLYAKPSAESFILRPFSAVFTGVL